MRGYVNSAEMPLQTKRKDSLKESWDAEWNASNYQTLERVVKPIEEEPVSYDSASKNAVSVGERKPALEGVSDLLCFKKAARFSW